MLAGEIKGLFCFGQNPAVGGANARLIRAGLDKLEWMVVADLFEHETAELLEAAGRRPGQDPDRGVRAPRRVRRREGGQHRQQRPLGAVALPRGEAHRRQPSRPRHRRRARAGHPKQAYAKDGVFPEPIRHLAWDYGHEPDPHRVARELNGQFLADVAEQDGTRVRRGQAGPGLRSAAGRRQHLSGNWIYCGGYTEEGNLAARREHDRRPQRHRAASELGLGLADEPPHPLQPRLGQPQGRAVQSPQAG